jgi:putative flippase GtrA
VKLSTILAKYKTYLIVGISVYIFEVAIILVTQHLGGSSLLAVTLSFWFGLVASFLLQKLVTFKDKRMHHKVLINQIVLFSLLCVFNYGFTLLAVWLLSPPIPTVICRTGALGLTTLWNFAIYKTRLFKSINEPVVY